MILEYLDCKDRLFTFHQEKFGGGSLRVTLVAAFGFLPQNLERLAGATPTWVVDLILWQSSRTSPFVPKKSRFCETFTKFNFNKFTMWLNSNFCLLLIDKLMPDIFQAVRNRLNETAPCLCSAEVTCDQVYVSTAHENAHVCQFGLLIGALCKASVYIRICGHKH